MSGESNEQFPLTGATLNTSGGAESTSSSTETARETIALNPALLLPGEKPGELIGSYKLLEKIGEGGMGTVWVAEQCEPIRRRVALKVVKLGMDTRQVVARFEAERQALAIMDHPNIAKVLDAGATENGRPYFVMELVNGTRITDYCDLHNVPTRRRLELFVQVCRAVAHAHQKGIIHRDLKPPNILVTVNDTAPAPRIIDFGIAKAIAGQCLTDKTVYTAFEEFIGTPAYMSPEQAEMTPLGIDARTDVYSLGVLLYELLTGATPFASERFQKLGPNEIRQIIREEEPPRPSTRLTTLQLDTRTNVARRHQCDPPKLLHFIRGDLDWIVMKCLDKDRTRRYQTAEELATDVQRHLNGEAIVARPPGQLYRLGKLTRRHRSALVVATVTLLATCATLAVVAFVWPDRFSFLRATPERRLARALKLLAHYDEQAAIPDAIYQLKEGLKSDSRDFHLWAALGWANWLLSGEDELEETRAEASNCASRALSFNPNNSQAHLVEGLAKGFVQDWVSATNHLWTAKTLTTSSDPIVLVSLAAVLQASGDAAKANEIAILAEQEARGNWDVFDRLGTFYYQSEFSDAALRSARQMFEKAVELAPRSPLAHRNLGNILLLQGDRGLALEHYQRSLALRRTSATLSAIGSLYNRQRRFDLAADYFRDASLLDPSKFIYHASAGLASLEIPARRTEATNHFFQALRQIEDVSNPANTRPLLRAYQGLCLGALARPSEARAALELAITNAGSDFRILRVARDAYRILGDTNRVRELEVLLPRKKNN
jgi:serine/threonine protein kinase/tetratricopeptide (TPR) repeat protein